MTSLARRDFLRLALAVGAAGALPGCGDDERYTEQDAENLRAQKRLERERSGSGPFGPQRYAGYRGLASLPWFDIDASGRLVCVDPSVPQAIDMHTHLGFALFLAPALDLHAASPRVQYLLDCDAEEPPCPLDLDVYINANFRPEDLRALRLGAVAQLTVGSTATATHTIPNLLREMDDSRVEQALVLPIEFGLPLDDDLTQVWREAILEAKAGERLLPGCSVAPGDPDAIDKLRTYAAGGARAIKLHPAGQRFYPDDPAAMEIYAECGRLGMPVLFHAGRAGIEPERTHRYTLMKNYEAMLGRFPDVRFGFLHAGARDVADAIPLAQRYPNVWLGIHGQGVTVLDQLIREVGSDRLVYGSDWPFYPEIATLAKVLIVTQERPEAREAILRGNALRLLG